jgi:galactokinase
MAGSHRIVSRAPGRVNLIGDHTDYTGGLVFPMTIDRWTRIDGSPHPRVRLVSDDAPEPVDLAVDAAFDPSPPAGWARIVAAVVAEVRPESGIDGRVRTSIPIGAGLSSSAALELALALALGFEGTAVDLARLGQRAEHLATGVPTGIMDQLCIAMATSGHATLIDCDSLSVTQVPIPDDVDVVVRFVANRTLVGSAYADRVAECAAAEAVIGPLRTASLATLDAIGDETVRRRARHVITENDRVRDFAVSLQTGDFRLAGQIMSDGHRSLRDDFATSTPAMDAAVEEMMAVPGVLGARMTGGGFGGCVVAITEAGAGLDGWTVRPVGGAERIS